VLKALWGIMMANPIVLIIAIIVALVAVFVTLWNKCEWFRDFWINLWERIKATFIAVITSIKGAFSQVVQHFQSKVNGIKQVANSIINAFKNLPNQLLNIGKNIALGLWNGISGMKNYVINKVKGMGKSIINGLKSALGIHSPSTEFAMIGKFSVLGYTEALDNMQKDIQDKVKETFGLSPQLTGSMNNHFSPNVMVNNNIDVSTDPLGQTVKKIKTFSGGAKNDYNYGMGV
jgi:phage-related protein